MKQFKKILCPYDFSECGEEALKYALQLASEDTRLTLLHVVQFPYTIDAAGFISYDIKEKEIERISEEEALKKVTEWKMKYPTLHIELKFVVNDDPAQAILKTQAENHYELIIMGTRGKNRLSKLPIGSVAESVLHTAGCPVFIIKKEVNVSLVPQKDNQVLMNEI